MTFIEWGNWGKEWGRERNGEGRCACVVIVMRACVRCLCVYKKTIKLCTFHASVALGSDWQATSSSPDVDDLEEVQVRVDDGERPGHNEDKQQEGLGMDGRSAQAQARSAVTVGWRASVRTYQPEVYIEAMTPHVHAHGGQEETQHENEDLLSRTAAFDVHHCSFAHPRTPPTRAKTHQR